VDVLPRDEAGKGVAQNGAGHAELFRIARPLRRDRLDLPRATAVLSDPIFCFDQIERGRPINFA
jgi:hypothetical protein